MPSFGSASNLNLLYVHSEMIRLFEEVVKRFDCSIICGRRDEYEQNRAFLEGRSTKRYPESTHNGEISKAVDVIPYPFAPKDWKDLGRLYMFVGKVQAIASIMEIPIRCGADWDGDGYTKDQNFHDLPHFEYIGKKESDR